VVVRTLVLVFASIETFEVIGLHRLAGFGDRLVGFMINVVIATAIVGVGLWAGIELFEDAGPARVYCEKLLARSVMAKDTHVTTMRLAPPLMIAEKDLDFAIEQVLAVLHEGLA
jgi:ornithine--oxo-acid transaminase